jgi:hypothetical protein
VWVDEGGRWKGKVEGGGGEWVRRKWKVVWVRIEDVCRMKWIDGDGVEIERIYR